MNNQDVDIGYLNINVMAVRNSQPIAGAKVTISKPTTVIEVLTTDPAGQTETVELATPPIEYSEAVLGVKPYSEYEVTVEAPGYEEVVNGVQLLPQSTAIQEIRLRAKTSNQTEGFQKISIEQHTLWGTFPPKIPEDDVKPLPDGEGFIVLSAPTIPEFMVVHLGTPNDTAARNVWIPFKEYITNVACCEIYSTWPEQSIRANVLAILSFALNRVYTEWYRGKGYNFTITNSTAYDQKFDYGRNIFYNVSNIVDEIFTTFITKPGIRQPLFTQFCDGVRVSCAGLEQWGSKDLGAKGQDALTILRTYYGTDIYLAQADKVQGVPISYPGQSLQIGSVGMDVRTIQVQLNSISNNFPMIPKLKVDGIYGPNTAQAIKTFQQIFYLPATGVVDLATWYKISNIYVAVNRLSELG